MSVFAEAVRESFVSDLFKSGTDLANLGVLGLLALGVVVLGWLHFRADIREEKRGDAAAQLAATLSQQFDRALDLLERQASRRRSGDGR